jgi:cytochrome c-type biogenesis protein CcmH
VKETFRSGRVLQHTRRLSTLTAVWLLMAFSSVLASQAELSPGVFEIASQLRCPVCVSESVAQSSSPTSVQMREIIAEKLAAGESEAEILAFFQARYGDWILLEPPRRGMYLFVWIMPLVAGALALALLVYYIRSWHRRAQEPVLADPAYLARVQQHLEQPRHGKDR